MIFRICEKNEPILYQRDVVRLQIDNWDDFGFKTSFDVTYYDYLGREQYLGQVQIGKKGMRSGRIADYLPVQFTRLPEQFFSLGQDEDYYVRIGELGDSIRQMILLALQDLAFQPDLLKVFREEPVLQKSLLRGIAASQEAATNKITGQFHRMAQGGARLTKYHFAYTNNDSSEPVTLDFSVDPDSRVPTNVHALIGSNGCGKTYLIRKMVQCLQEKNGGHGQFDYLEDGGSEKFVNVLCVAFSPFDDFSQLIKDSPDIPASYVGLNKKEGELLKTVEDQFWGHFQNCLITQRRMNLWVEAIQILKNDVTFRNEGIDAFMKGLRPGGAESIPPEKEAEIRTVFRRLSSGHKVVLLIVTSCVAEIEERSILFLDEPENHLHPPLLSALIRALSNLLKDRNGVAIVTTHSPVVLQELPTQCVQVLNRRRTTTTVNRLDIQTFGATVGLLTQKVFGLGSRTTGFYQVLRGAVAEYGTYEDVINAFAQSGDKKTIDTKDDLQLDPLGDQAEIMLRTMLMLKERGLE